MAENASSVKDVFERLLPERFQTKPDLLSKVNAVYQFQISGSDGGAWCVDCTAPGGQVSAGTSAAATCTVSATDKDFLGIVNGKLNPQMAFMSGKLRIAGDIGLAMKLQLLIG